MRRASNYIFGKYLLCAGICLPGLLSYAQRRHGPAPAAAPVTVQATADKDKIYIGQPVRVMLEATVPDNVTFSWPVIDSLPHFERLDSAKIDTTVSPGEHYYRQYLTVTSWDSGAWAIPRLAFLAGGKKVFSDSVRIYVDYTKADPSKDFHDIKDIIEVPNPFAKWIGWIVAACTLLSLALVVWLVRRKKLLRKWIPSIVRRRSPYEEAMQQLDELTRQRLPEAGKVKVYYSRMGEVLREYLLQRLGIASFAETSEELIGEIRKHRLLPADLFDALADALRMSDFVKFAKYQPEAAESLQHYSAVRGAIDSIEQREKAAAESLAQDGRGGGEDRDGRGGGGNKDGQGLGEDKKVIQQTN